jgi:hypothetical protein
MKHAIRHIHFVAYSNVQSKPGLHGAATTDAAKRAGGLTA